VAVFEPPDAGAMHTEAADEAVQVESYLDAAELVKAAKAAGADAVHPGYGFLAENAEFAERVQRAGLAWIGPPPEAMRSLGDKVEARRLAEAAGLRVVPGYAGVDLSDDTLIREAERLGAPLVVKAAAGGGGRGMRTVADLGQMPGALAAARREAAAAFGDDRVFVERQMPAVRHVEVQLLADAHGTVLHLGERDCSVQRRHQKVIEESPSPAVDPALRAQLGEAAVELGRAAGYVGAGTVEFLLDGDGGWYFLELNARLQVEHPVTEAVTGIDLVRAQIEIAGGAPLLTEQDEVSLRGHALQCRLYAEDPARDFLPATGRLERFEVPAWPGGRTDAGVRAGDVVGVRYDPLLAKVIAYAEDRDACLDRILAMLRETVVLGVETNLGFLLHTLDDPVFRSGDADTSYVEQRWSAALIPELPPGVASFPAGDVWHEYGNGAQVPGVRTAGSFALYRGFGYRIGADDAGPVALAAPGGSLQAPMPGVVLRLAVEIGDVVEQSQPLVILEAMKMELTVAAPAAGRVRSVLVAPGQLVTAGQPLVELGES
jgi:acetyl/propionyl-CoA carboxylase alpha subunit